ncbi:MAG: hypothetical protein HWE25_09060 [Alphaproteobacteria bacterium]|nr:hypothetical protein [Alphaproteobacteria bacterium]
MGALEDWLSYELVDFLMFSPDVYFRMVASYVQYSWPIAALYVSGLAAALWWWYRQGDMRPVNIAVAVGWALPAYMFFLVRYADIMTASPGFAALFGVEVVLLGWAALRPPPAISMPSGLGAGGWALMCVAAAYPVVAPSAGRAWDMGEPLGLMPDPIVLLTTAWFVLCGERRVLPWLAPAIWAIASGLTLHTMGEPDYWLLPILVAVAAILNFTGKRRLAA